MSTWSIGKHSIVPSSPHDHDPRGLLFMFEEPRKDCRYIVGVDPTIGIAHWNRNMRVADDTRTDNACIQVVRVGKPDVQVAEFAAPMDALDLAPICNTIGHLYAGNSEDRMALIIGELQGSGILVVRELLDRFGYTNIWRWAYLNYGDVRRTNTFWWNATREGNRLLFSKCLHHITHHRVKIQSPWLIEEMADCTMDVNEAKIKSLYGRHDDRVRAFFLALWASHEWLDEEKEDDVVVDTAQPDWQKTDISVENMYHEWRERFDTLLGDE